MLSIKRLVRVIFDEDAQKSYEKLVEAIKTEKEKGIKNSDNQKLLKSIDGKVEMLKYSPKYGVHISRKLWPNKYTSKYGITNLWKVDLVNYWRMMYTLQGDKIEIICFVLDIIDHPEYNKVFGYKKK